MLFGLVDATSYPGTPRELIPKFIHASSPPEPPLPPPLPSASLSLRAAVNLDGSGHGILAFSLFLTRCLTKLDQLPSQSTLHLPGLPWPRRVGDAGLLIIPARFGFFASSILDPRFSSLAFLILFLYSPTPAGWIVTTSTLLILCPPGFLFLAVLDIGLAHALRHQTRVAEHLILRQLPAP